MKCVVKRLKMQGKLISMVLGIQEAKWEDVIVREQREVGQGIKSTEKFGR